MLFYSVKQQGGNQKRLFIFNEVDREIFMSGKRIFTEIRHGYEKTHIVCWDF